MVEKWESQISEMVFGGNHLQQQGYCVLLISDGWCETFPNPRVFTELMRTNVKRNVNLPLTHPSTLPQTSPTMHKGSKWSRSAVTPSMCLCLPSRTLTVADCTWEQLKPIRLTVVDLLPFSWGSMMDDSLEDVGVFFRRPVPKCCFQH